MKKIVFTLAAFIVVATLLALTNSKPLVKQENENGFVVMELFTSQGCSSCPPADEVLGSYVQKMDSRIIPIAFHVDYWNQLGWKDPFSNHQYAERQENYDANFLHATVYTPQLIINGEKEFVGSDKTNIKHAVDNTLNEIPAVIINIKSNTIGNGQVQAHYTIGGGISNATLNAVLIQNKTTTKINAGENNGTTLINYNVARQFVSVIAKESGTCEIQLPVGVNTKELSLVLFTQDKTSGKITGAVKEDL
jgi:hypothetical protein